MADANMLQRACPPSGSCLRPPLAAPYLRSQDNFTCLRIEQLSPKERCHACTISSGRRNGREQRNRSRNRYGRFPHPLDRPLLTRAVRNLALQYPKSPFNNGPLLIYLTARSAEKGAEAVRSLTSDPQLKEAKVLAQDGGLTTIKFQELDISQTTSIQQFSEFLRTEHPQGLDFVINNAGIAMQGFDSNVVKTTLQTNYYGTLEATQDLLPLLRDNGRLVNVSSMAGKLNKYSDDIRSAFLQAAKTDVPACTALMERFSQAAADGKEKEAGFPSAAYAVSKAGETAFTKAIAVKEARRGRGVLVNVSLFWCFHDTCDLTLMLEQACCPGYVKTDMTKGGGAKTPDQGAQTPVMLALHDIGGKTGGFWQSEKEIDW